MSKIKKIIIPITITLCIILSFIILYNLKHPIVYGIKDKYSKSFNYNNIHYSSSVYFVAEDDLKYMGTTEEKISDVYFIGNSESPDYIFVSGDDNFTCYKADYASIETSGNITKVLIDPTYGSILNPSLSSKEEIDMIYNLVNIQGEEKEYFIENYYTQGNSFYYAYNNCPVASNNSFGGYIASIGNEWIYVNPENFKNSNYSDNQNEHSLTVKGIAIKDKSLLDKILKSKLIESVE